MDTHAYMLTMTVATRKSIPVHERHAYRLPEQLRFNTFETKADADAARESLPSYLQAVYKVTEVLLL